MDFMIQFKFAEICENLCSDNQYLSKTKNRSLGNGFIIRCRYFYIESSGHVNLSLHVAQMMIPLQ